jgi:hypothetical protein
MLGNQPDDIVLFGQEVHGVGPSRKKMSPTTVSSPISPWSPGRYSPSDPWSQGESDTPRSGRPQFQARLGGMSNLDRCNWCGSPRSVHGIDWSCPSRAVGRGKHPVAFIAATGLVALAGVVLLTISSQTALTTGTLGASVVLAGLVVLICAVTIAGRRRAGRGS